MIVLQIIMWAIPIIIGTLIIIIMYNAAKGIDWVGNTLDRMYFIIHNSPMYLLGVVAINKEGSVYIDGKSESPRLFGSRFDDIEFDTLEIASRATNIKLWYSSKEMDFSQFKEIAKTFLSIHYEDIDFISLVGDGDNALLTELEQSMRANVGKYVYTEIFHQPRPNERD